MFYFKSHWSLTLSNRFPIKNRKSITFPVHLNDPNPSVGDLSSLMHNMMDVLVTVLSRQKQILKTLHKTRLLPCFGNVYGLRYGLGKVRHVVNICFYENII